MKLISIVCIVLLISAFNMPVMAESNIPVLPDYDNLSLSGLETKSITEGIDAVLQNDEGMLSISREIYEAIVNHVCEGQTLLAESRNTMPGENEEVNLGLHKPGGGARSEAFDLRTDSADLCNG